MYGVGWAAPRPPQSLPTSTRPRPVQPSLQAVGGHRGPDRATLCRKPEIGLLGLRRGTAPTTGQTGGRGRCPRNLHVVGPAPGPPPRPSATGTPRGRPPKPPDPGPKQNWNKTLKT